MGEQTKSWFVALANSHGVNTPTIVDGCIHGILLNHKKNEIEPFVEMWMDLESVMQSEVSQTEKNKYCILTRVCRVSKNGTDEPICRAGIELLTHGTDVDARGEGENGTNWEIETDIYPLLCVKY